MQLTRSSAIIAACETARTVPVQTAVADLSRDLGKALTSDEEGAAVVLDEDLERSPEAYVIDVQADGVHIRAADELGFVYGLYAISRELLGIADLWFWMDQEIAARETLQIDPAFTLESRPSPIRLRGWFINDEVLFFGWAIDGDELGPWRMAFEALLRLGGNMVIPGTGQLDTSRYEEEADRRGLVVAQHHAEPLGAEMFSHAYPELRPSYDEHPDLFEKLWLEAIRARAGRRTMWSLGFRGQGDLPFWIDDPRYDTDEDRGALIGKILKLQYDLVQEHDPGAACAVNLYGETLELFRGGHLSLPDDVVKIWADNGYGRMVSRRQGSHNPRVPALPEGGERAGAHGIYCHASFYDLQAAYTLTMLPSPTEKVVSELESVIAHGMTDAWLINCSAVRPHTYTLDVIAALWREGAVDVAAHRGAFVRRHFGQDAAREVARLYGEYFATAVAYGAHWDEKAGEQLPNCVTRDLVTQFLREPEAPSSRVAWLLQHDSLAEQVRSFEEMCARAAADYATYRDAVDHVGAGLDTHPRRLLAETLGLQSRILEHSYRGAAHAMRALALAFDGAHWDAFLEAGRARRAFLGGDTAMRGSEHGVWHGFYANDAQADLSHSAWLLESLMNAIRVAGDGPDYVDWQRAVLYPPETRDIRLLMTVEKHLDNIALWEAIDVAGAGPVQLTRPDVEGSHNSQPSVP